MSPVLVGRTQEITRLRRILAGGAGAVVIGDAGVGKSHLVAEAVSCSPGPVHRVTVTEAAATVALGPLIPLGTEVEQAAASPAVAALAFGAVRRALTGEADSTDSTKDATARPVLVVDDAHLLDPLSAGVMHQLVVLGAAVVIATVRSGNRPPDAIDALWTGAGCERIELGPLGRTDTAELFASLLGGPLEARTEHIVWTLSQGNPLLVRELVLAGTESGALVAHDSRWFLDGELPSSTRLVDLVDSRLARLPDTARAAVELLTMADPVDPYLLRDVIDPDDLLTLERARVIELRDDDPDTPTLTFVHPLYGEVLRAGLPQGRRAAIARELCAAVHRRGIAAVDPLRLAAWRLDGGLATTEELIGAAELALQRTAAPLAVRLARQASMSGDEPRATFALGMAQATLGQVDEALGHLRRLLEPPPETPTRTSTEPALRIRAVIAIANLLVAPLARFDEAFALLATELDRPDLPPALRDEVAAATSLLHMLLGQLDEAAEGATRLVDSGHASDGTRLLALTSGSLADALRLQPDAVHTQVQAGLDLLDRAAGAPPNTADLLHANSCAGFLLAGELDRTRRLCRERRALALAHDAIDSVALWTLLAAQLAMAEGDVRLSAVLADDVVQLCTAADPLALGPLARVEAAHAAAVMGDVDRSRQHLDTVPDPWRTTRRIESRDATVRAWLAAHEHGTDAAAEQAIDAGDRADRDGVPGWAVDAWHVAVRLGRADGAAPRLRRIAASTGVERVALLADHADAVAGRDAESLITVARRFGSSGHRLLAAEAAAQAAEHHRRAGRAESARRAAAMGAAVLPEAAGAATPVLTELALDVGLTPREREISLLAARGASSQDIADRLGLSRRTVDNRLTRVYTKLGIAGRTELADVLVLPTAPG
ncbi:MAG: helix-turn-helix transcriptional regulator [Ilumatobacter sp.]|nr:MAG: helix-turn-helix transcriptional regulator [Ilumatobacter sp.]